MRTLAAVLTVVCLLGAAGLAGADRATYQGPWLDSVLVEWTPDSGAVPGERALWSPEYWVWSPFPEMAAPIYDLQVRLNGKPIAGEDMIQVGKAYMIPADALTALALGVTYSADNMTITVTAKGHTLVSRLYARQATVDGLSQAVKVPSRWQRGKRYISLDLIGQAFSLVVAADHGQIFISAY
jgi:hypothetical protein